ncbi:DUF6252 family protein [Rasiella sp. SM2506]|uniref:DUF6252 family protein n=1 Tax=Rasiella sp. SM2506 TaxID=3423914 RepID=UPI003D7BB7CB
MKTYFLLLCIVCFFVSCEDIEDNSPAFQANLDTEFYKALDAKAIVAEDGTVAIVGATTDQNITLILSVLQSGSFQFNSGNGHQAIYEDAAGQQYSTEFEGNGVVNITGRGTDAGNEFLSGDFTFTAILKGVDTVTVSRGVLYQVPIISGILEDPTDPDNPNLDGNFVAEIDGELFDPSTVVGTTTGTSIQINGALGDDTIQLIIPLDAEPATQAIPGDGFDANYFISGVQEPAISGTIRVFAHDMAAKSISGTFSFVTENHVISLGQFNIEY